MFAPICREIFYSLFWNYGNSGLDFPFKETLLLYNALSWQTVTEEFFWLKRVHLFFFIPDLTINGSMV